MQRSMKKTFLVPISWTHFFTCFNSQKNATNVSFFFWDFLKTSYVISKIQMDKKDGSRSKREKVILAKGIQDALKAFEHYCCIVSMTFYE